MLIESVPNVSEGRRADIVDALAAVVGGTAGVRLLDYSRDPSHNRSVFTFVGGAAAVREAALALVNHAVGVIDLRTHQGVHPRMGAVDVLPFVPIADATMADCVALAREAGAAIAARHGIPVFLYEEAASDPRRRNLEDVRRGGFEGLAAKLARPEWAPDFGPATPHPTAGAIAVGARMPLIAFNVNLASDRLDVAQAIARAVRFSSGGLPCLKALGVRLDHRGLVQVSMNLTNYERTPLSAAFARVVEEARGYGVEVVDSEIIGLVPERALEGTTAEELRLTRPPLLLPTA